MSVRTRTVVQQTDIDRLMWNALEHTEPFGVEDIAKTYEINLAHRLLQRLVREGHLRITNNISDCRKRRQIRYEWIND